MKPQNFYNFLEDKDICAESILTYCEEIKSLEKGILRYFRSRNETERRISVNMQVLGASSKEELEQKKAQEIKDKKKIIKNISKFISFMKKEGEEHFKILESEELQDWLDNEENEEDEFFQKIDCIPAYIHKHSGVMVLDLIETFGHIMNLLKIDIEEIIGTTFPLNGNKEQYTLVKQFVGEKNIVLDQQKSSLLLELVTTYEDFNALISFIKTDIRELEEPIKFGIWQ